MNIYLNDKPCFILVSTANSHADYSTGPKNQFFSFELYTSCIIRKKRSDIFNSIKFEKKENISKNSKLFFCKTTDFPRTRLVNTSFTRVIKPEKADYIVVTRECIESFYHYRNSTLSIIETEKSYYIINFESLNRYFSSNNTRQEHTRFIQALKANTAKVIRDNAFMKEEDSTILAVASEECTIIDNKALIADMPILLNQKFKFITDGDLSFLVDSQCESFTEESLSSISDMISSKDPSVQALGLKLLSNYNIEECKDYIHFIICSNPSLNECPAWTSASVKELLKKIGFYSFYGRGETDILFRNEILKRPTNEVVAKTMASILKKQVINALKKIISKGCYESLNSFDLDLDIDVKERK